ncbi:glycosyltransferase family 2 protein [Ferruginibacter albus]|uniref:glycosyltransferase family 2 protein n=1 Tax=Ferruginibacter albus TaxID=2875540 RepID=UPI001CC65179|nr:glycosyltransferase family 2 protein [Ferruginibacter albus]UAY50998.1 glycosyltransferase family 2 protein [Ferruginibacter albus]
MFSDSISLIISTYNNPAFLELILLSILQQKVLPDEVVVADDGSTPETKTLVDSYKKTFPVPLVHVWHEDEGFRQSAIKNKAAATATSNYLIFIDGDLMLHPCFIYDYKVNIKPNSILVASRVFLSETYTKHLLATKNTIVNKKAANIEKNRFSAYRIPWLHHFIKGSKTHYAARGGLMGIFKKDYIRINGFDESFTGWGREDSELFVRIINSGIERYNIKFAAITYHLWHKTLSRQKLPDNDLLLERSISEKRTWCEDGINKYL